MRHALILTVLLASASCAPAPETSTDPVVAATFDGAAASDRADRIAHGQRLGSVLGCDSCHGEDYQGGNYSDDPDGGYIFASNLTRRVPTLSDGELEKLLRDGVHPRREALWYMPAKTLQRLSEPDMASLIEFLRTLEPAGRDWPLPQGGEATEALLEFEILEQSPALVEQYRRESPPPAGAGLALGRYIAAVTCAECHGPGLEGGAGTPPLTNVSALGRERLAMLLRTGTRYDGSAHGMMRLVAVRNLSALTEEETDALLDYLMTLGPPETSE